jgi:hypothetical protein
MNKISGIPVSILNSISIHLCYETVKEFFGFCQEAEDLWQRTYQKEPLLITAEMLRLFDRHDSQIFISNWVNSIICERWYRERGGRWVGIRFPYIPFRTTPPRQMSSYRLLACALKAYILARFRPEVFEKLGGKYED